MQIIKVLLKIEVARLFEVSVKTLINWINEYPILLDELIYYGYNSNQKYLTIKQIEILFKYLGSPFELANEKIPIKSYSKKQIAKFYGISLPTLKSMINNIQNIAFLNENNCKIYDYLSVTLIFDNLGYPFLQKNELLGIKK